MKLALVLVAVWLRWTLPATEPGAIECQPGGLVPETSIATVEIHGAPLWLGYELGPRPWPGIRDSLLARIDVRGKSGADSTVVQLPGTWTTWTVVKDFRENPSCKSGFHVVLPELATAMPAAWPFRVPRAQPPSARVRPATGGTR